MAPQDQICLFFHPYFIAMLFHFLLIIYCESVPQIDPSLGDLHSSLLCCASGNLPGNDSHPWVFTEVRSSGYHAY